MATVTAARAKSKTRKAAKSDTVEHLGRFGNIARGVLYLVVGTLAANVARGSAEQADRQGAVRAIGQTTFGRVGLVLIAVGFAGYALWQLAEATIRQDDRGTASRLKAAGHALLYTFLCVTTVGFVVTRHSENTDDKDRNLTARVMEWPGGRFLVAAVGLSLIAMGVANAARALTGRYRKHLKEGEIDRRTLRWLKPFAYAGLAARTVAFSLVGTFFIQAAVTYDPSKARGLDDSLRQVAKAPFGEAMIVLVAIGLVAYGLWLFVEARYRDVLGS